MAERKAVVQDQAWFDAAFRVIRTAPQAQAEVELRCLIRDVGTAAMARAMRVWLDVRARSEKTPTTRAGPKAAKLREGDGDDSWFHGLSEAA
jgi:hypothetical protein